MSDFIELQLATSEQHVEMRVSRIKRDFEDINKMITWLQNHNPFDDTDPSLRSLSFGQAQMKKMVSTVTLQKTLESLCKRK